MNNIMYKIVYADIKMLELKLKIITHKKELLMDLKPSWLYIKRFRDWNLELAKLEKEEIVILNQLNKAYRDLEEFI